MMTAARIVLYLIMAVGFLFVINLVFLVPGVYDRDRFLLMSIGASVVLVALFLHGKLTDLDVRRRNNSQ